MFNLTGRRKKEEHGNMYMYIKKAEKKDLDVLANAAATCFPAAEAASKERIEGRLSVYPDYFWIGRDEFHELVCYAAGPVTKEGTLTDNMYADPQPVKLFYVTPAFRYEKPQSGRLRQHHQFGVEMVGSSSPMVEVELISLISTIIKNLGLKDTKLHINSIGCANCRKEYNKALYTYLKSHEGELCETCKERMEKNPLRVLDCKVDAGKGVIENAPRTIDYLDDECKQHFEELKSMLTELNIPFEVDTGIVRGLDYYTKTVFEFVDSEGFTLCGGGRYDGLIKEIDEKHDIPSAGFGMGIERIIYFLEKEGVELPSEEKPKLYVGILGKEARARAYTIVNELRQKGVVVETDYMDRSVKAQMKYANKIGAQYTVIVGDNELQAGCANVKNMENGETKEVKLDEIADYLS